jgi:UDP-glucose 4-epimerase
MCLRYFNAAGADPDGEIGECHDPETHLIPLAIRAAQDTYPALNIFGTDYETPDGTAVRDYIHVCHLAAAHVRALGYLARGGESTALNIGSGIGHSVRDVQRTVKEICGRVVPARIRERRPGDPAVVVADATKARKLLGWEPRFTFQEILETAWQWQSVHRTAARVV